MSDAMPAYVRILIAAVGSLLIHITLMMGIIGSMRPVKFRPPDPPMKGLLQVTLHPSINKGRAPSRPQGMEAMLFKTKKPDLKIKRALRTVSAVSDNPKSVPPVAENSQLSGHFRWRPPSTYQQNEMMNAMQLGQIAFQRQAQVAAVLEGLSTVSAQLAPIITANIVCTQQANDDLTCEPEPKENEHLLINQFFNLAIQARRLGMTGNPVHMDFGPTLGVSILLQ